MLNKKKTKKILAISMAFSMIFCSNAFATPIDVVNSTEDVKNDTLTKTEGTDYFIDEENEWQSGTINEEVRVKVDLASQFTVTIPKEIVLDGSTGKADYKVKAVGDIAGDQVLIVVPDANFILSEKGGKDDQTAIVTQPNTQYTYRDLQGTGTEYDGNITATLSAGEWAGKFNFNINFKAERCEHDYIGIITKEATFTETGIKTNTCTKCNHSYTEIIPIKEKLFNDYSWAEIAAISEAGNATSTFAVGDEKELQIGSETYHVQILGFDHDVLSEDTNRKAGITVGLKEVMTTKHKMNSNGINVGGWKTSEMRTYLQDNILPTLPSDLQSVIKTVDKKSDAGNKDTTTLNTTQDKLFLLSFEEVGFTTNDSKSFVAGQGTKYDYFTDNTSRTKKNNSAGWWLRSAHTSSTSNFYYVISGGSYYSDSAYCNIGVVFGFSI